MGNIPKPYMITGNIQFLYNKYCGEIENGRYRLRNNSFPGQEF